MRAKAKLSGAGAAPTMAVFVVAPMAGQSVVTVDQAQLVDAIEVNKEQKIVVFVLQRGLAYEEPRYSDGRYTKDELLAKNIKAVVWSLPGGGIRPWIWRKHVP